MTLHLPKTRHDLIVQKVRDDFVVKDPISSNFFEFNIFQVAIMRQLDGKTSIEQVAEDIGDQFDAYVPVSHVRQFVEQLASSMLLEPESLVDLPDRQRRRAAKNARKRIDADGLLDNIPVEAEGMPELDFFRQGVAFLANNDVAEAARYLAVASEINPDNERVTLAAAHVRQSVVEVARPAGGSLGPQWAFAKAYPFLSWLHQTFKFIFTRWFFVSWLILTIFGIALLAWDWPRYTRQLADYTTLSNLTASRGVITWLVAVTVLFIHECAHGVACVHYGGQPNRMGFMLAYYVMPAAFCDVSDTYLFSEREGQIVTFLAGVGSSFILWSIAVPLWFIVKPDTVLGEALFVYTLLCGAQNVFQLLPLIRLDGYYILSSAIHSRSLASEGWAAVRHSVRRRTRGALRRPWPRLLFVGVVNTVMCPVIVIMLAGYGFALSALLFAICWSGAMLLFLWVRRLEGLDISRVVATYGWLALAYRISITFFVVATLWRVLVPAIGFFGVLLMLFAVRGLIRTTMREATPPDERNQPFLPRLARWSVPIVVWLVVDVVVLSAVPWRQPSVGDVTLRFAAAKQVRSKVDGQLAKVVVAEGQHVKRGQVLAVLENAEVVSVTKQADARHRECLAELSVVKRGLTAEERKLQRRRLARAWVQVSEAARAFKRTARLKGVIPQLTIQDAKADVVKGAANAARAAAARRAKLSVDPELIKARIALCESAAAVLAQARDQQDRLELRSPIDGVVTTPRLADHRGEWVKAGQSVLEVAKIELLRGDLLLDRDEPVDGLRPGYPVRIYLGAGHARPLMGEVSWVSPRTSDAITKSLGSHNADKTGEALKKRVLVHISIKDAPKWVAANMSGRARIIGPRRSLLYVTLSRPIKTFFSVHFWKIL